MNLPDYMIIGATGSIVAGGLFAIVRGEIKTRRARREYEEKERELMKQAREAGVRAVVRERERIERIERETPVAKAAPATRSQPKPTATAAPATRKESKPRPSGRQMDRFRDDDSLLNPSNPLSVAHPANPANPINLDSGDSKPSRCEPDRSSMFESSSERSSSYCSGSSGSSSYDSGSCSSTSSSSCD